LDIPTPYLFSKSDQLLFFFGILKILITGLIHFKIKNGNMSFLVLIKEFFYYANQKSSSIF
jgi:hypothetical protein